MVNNGWVSSDPDVVSITTLNSKPTADAGPDQRVYVGDAVTLNGSDANLSDPASTHPAFAVDRPGTYVVQLTVNDGSADSAPDTVVISTLNSRPVASGGPDQSVPVGT